MREEHAAGTNTVGSAFEGNPLEGSTRRKGPDLMVLGRTRGMDGSPVDRARGGREGKGLVDAIISVGQTRTLPNVGIVAWSLPTPRRVNPLGGKPSTGGPDAGNPPVRFGGRGGRTRSAFPTPIRRTRSHPACLAVPSRLFGIAEKGRRVRMILKIGPRSGRC